MSLRRGCRRNWTGIHSWWSAARISSVMQMQLAPQPPGNRMQVDQAQHYVALQQSRAEEVCGGAEAQDRQLCGEVLQQNRPFMPSYVSCAAGIAEE